MIRFMKRAAVRLADVPLGNGMGMSVDHAAVPAGLQWRAIREMATRQGLSALTRGPWGFLT